VSENIKKNHDAELKFKVALAMMMGSKSVPEICQEFDIVQSQAYAWKQNLEERGCEIFADKRKTKKEPTYEKLLSELEQVREECNFLERVLNH